MGFAVCGGAALMCSFGAAPGTLMVTPANRCSTGMPIANIMDNKPFVNIMPFGMCTSPSNPSVAAASGAPMPCVPNTTAPWTPGSPKVMIGGFPALNNSCKLMCMWAGVIQIQNPGQTAITVP
jgi:hypothetical protein